MVIQLIVFIKLFIANSIENPRVGSSIPSPVTTFKNNTNDKNDKVYLIHRSITVCDKNPHTSDKEKVVIFVITPVLLELQVDKTARVARHFALTLHTLFRVFECLDPGVRHCVYNLVKEHSSCCLN